MRTWDHPAAGQQPAVLTGEERQVDDLAVAPDGSWLATTSNSRYGEAVVQVRDPATGQERAVLPGRAVAMAPDGSWLATSNSRYGEAVRVWDPATGQERAALASSRYRASIVAIRKDTSWLTTAGARRDERVRVWDPATGQERAVLPGRAAAMGPDGSWLATISDSEHDGTTVWIWDAGGGRKQGFCSGRKCRLSAVAIAPDGRLLATRRDRDGMVEIWDSATLSAAPVGCHREDSEVAIAPDSSWLATSDGRRVRIWDPATGRNGPVSPPAAVSAW